MKKINLFLVFVFVLIVNARAAEEKIEYTFLKSKTQIKDPYSIRDPFKTIAPKKGMSKSREHAKGIFNNVADSIETKQTDTLKIIGIMIGRERRAMAKSGGETYIIKEGMKIGPNNAEVKAILPGGVVLVEKIKNIYDQDEYLETVLPVTGN